MRYLVKVFDSDKETISSTPHVASDDGDEHTQGSLWEWLWFTKRDGLEIAIYRMNEDTTKATPFDQVLTIDRDGKLIVRWMEYAEIAELKADPSIESYLLRGVLDLS